MAARPCMPVPACPDPRRIQREHGVGNPRHSRYPRHFQVHANLGECHRLRQICGICLVACRYFVDTLHSFLCVSNRLAEIRMTVVGGLPVGSAVLTAPDNERWRRGFAENRRRKLFGRWVSRRQHKSRIWGRRRSKWREVGAIEDGRSEDAREKGKTDSHK
ncbi:hypothetical protein GE21DRAFT_1064098 [Neurospora crassa]|nr:hypothetical protein GE21DRAFT_1064098 [Neurospora crassa]